MLCWLPSPRPVDGLKTLGSVVSRPWPKSPTAKDLVNATSAFWRRSPSCRLPSWRLSPRAPRQPISPSPGSRNDCPTRGPTRSDGSGAPIHNTPKGLHNAPSTRSTHGSVGSTSADVCQIAPLTLNASVINVIGSGPCASRTAARSSGHRQNVVPRTGLLPLSNWSAAGQNGNWKMASKDWHRKTSGSDPKS